MIRRIPNHLPRMISRTWQFPQHFVRLLVQPDFDLWLYNKRLHLSWQKNNRFNAMIHIQLKVKLLKVLRKRIRATKTPLFLICTFFSVKNTFFCKIYTFFWKINTLIRKIYTFFCKIYTLICKLYTLIWKKLHFYL